ncbi:MAG: hypothetical protein V7K90_07815 [Nostoc sp.]
MGVKTMPTAEGYALQLITNHSNSVLQKAFNKSIQLAIAFIGRDNQKL